MKTGKKEYFIIKKKLISINIKKRMNHLIQKPKTIKKRKKKEKKENLKKKEKKKEKIEVI